VISPLLVLLGLKHGTIHTLRERLVEDPVFREIRPAQTREFKPEWFEDVSSWPGIGFLTPTILPLSSVLSVVRTDTGKAELFDLIPTAAGDPLLLENGGSVPEDGEAVLTAEASRRLGVAAGEEIRRARDPLTRRTHRSGGAATQGRGGARSQGRIPAPDLRAPVICGRRGGLQGGLRGSCAGLDRRYARAVREFRRGRAPLAGAPSPITRSGLVINTGFGRIADITEDGAGELLGFSPPPGLAAYNLLSPGASITASNLRAIDQKLRGHTRADPALCPRCRDQVWRGGVAAHGLSVDEEEAGILSLPPTPWGGYTGRLPQGIRDVVALGAGGRFARKDVTAQSGCGRT
jgi:putative ABC transport system permease protein